MPTLAGAQERRRRFKGEAVARIMESRARLSGLRGTASEPVARRLQKAELADEIEVDSCWSEGYGSMTAVDASRVK